MANTRATSVRETGTGGKPPETDRVADALRKVVNGVQAAAANRNPNGYVSTADLRTSQTTLPENGLTVPKGDSKISNISNGKSGSGGGGGSRATYIGSDGSKQTGIASPTPGQTPDYYTQMGKLYQTAYDEQIAANNAALEEAQRRAQEATDAQIAALAEQYAGTNRQLYRDYMNSRRVLPQQMAAQGYNGGLSESSMLRLNNSYEEGLNENERARIAQEAAYQQALQQNLYDAGVRTNEANKSARQNLFSQQAALQEAIYRDTQQRAATMAASGDFSEYEKLGFSPSEIAYLKAMWRRMNPTLA